MLSYDTRKSDELISKAPIDVPEELIPGNQMHHGQTATRVPENAGEAAIERHISRPIYLETSYLSETSRRKPKEEQYVQEASEAIIKDIPEVLHDSYRVVLPDEEQAEILRKPEQLKVDGRTMTRAQYIRYVRERCEKELSYYPKFTPRPAATESENRMEIQETLPEEQQELTLEPVEEKEMPLVMKEHLEGEVYEEVPAELKEARKKHYLKVLWIRSIIALCIFIGLVSFDLLNGHIGNTGIKEVKEAVANNATIQAIEQIVSDFAENTVLPVFGVDKEKNEVAEEPEEPTD